MTKSSGEEAAAVEWPSLGRARQTVLVVDMVDSTRLMQAHEDSVIARWMAFVAHVESRLLPAHQGRLVKSLGDGMLLVFDSPGRAALASFDLHEAMDRLGAAAEAGDESLLLRCGLHVCDVVRDDHDIYGAGVNLAARLATVAAPGCTAASVAVRDELVPGLDAEVEDLGLCHFKNLDAPVRAFHLTRCSGPQQRRPLVPQLPVPGELRPLLAVLPFEQRGGSDAGDDRVIGDWIAEASIVLLSKAPTLRLVSRLSTTAFRGRQASAAELRAALRADYLVSGSYVARGARVTLSVELTDAADGAVVWAEHIAGSVDDLLAPQSETLMALVGGVQRAVVQSESRRSQLQAPPNLQSFSLQIGGITMMHRSAREDFERARVLLTHLIERHPRLAAPRAWLALWYVLRVTRGWVQDPAAEADRALELVRRARDADPDQSLALTMQGFVECHMLKQLKRAESTLDAALALNPSDSLAWLFKGVVYSLWGAGEQALSMVQEAGRLSPLDPLAHYYDALSAPAALAAGQPALAETFALRSLAVNRLHSPTWRALVIAQSELGEADKAQRSLHQLLALEPGLTVSSYLARSPAGVNDTRKRYAEALRRAGLPAG